MNLKTIYRKPRAIEAPPDLTRPLIPLMPPAPTGWFETPPAAVPSVRIATPARFFGPRRRPNPTPKNTPNAAVDVPSGQWRQRDPWVAQVMLGWPANLEAAGIDTSPLRFPAWDPDCCGHPVAASGFHELTLPCTLERGHARSGHEVRDTAGELMAETVKPAPRRKPSPQPRPKPVGKAS